MPRKRRESKADRMHRIALERLRRSQKATAEYFRVRVEEGVSKKFDAWEVDADGDASAGTKPPAPDEASPANAARPEDPQEAVADDNSQGGESQPAR